MALIIGLTGGIGAGKSTASAHFARLGVPVVDADRISRVLTGPGGRGCAAVADAFGPEMLDENGAMNRGKMRERVFRDPSALRKLEAILHPLIGEVIDAELASHRDAPVVIYDCPLLWRANFRRPGIDRILVIDEGELKMQGTPKEVFRDIERVRACGLDVPEMALLARDLRESGLKLPEDILSVEEMVVELCRLKSSN